jgi:protocatechuate 3,4-dioxygenase beta subunit
MLTPTLSVEDHHRHSGAAADLAGNGVTRRGMLTASATLAGAGLAGGMTFAFGQQSGLRPTNEQVLGPFYPVRLPTDQDADLTVIAGKDARALGQILYVNGRVTNVRGEPVGNAELEIWQANAVGRYTHPSDDNPLPIDPNFEGYAKIRTGPDGSYRFKTVKPGAYPVTPVPGWTRPPHIHFDVKGRASRLVTQMYFEGEALNDKDIFFQRASASGKDGLLARYGAPSGQQEPNALVAVWNIVLIAG